MNKKWHRQGKIILDQLFDIVVQLSFSIVINQNSHVFFKIFNVTYVRVRVLVRKFARSRIFKHAMYIVSGSLPSLIIRIKLHFF